MAIQKEMYLIILIRPADLYIQHHILISTVLLSILSDVFDLFVEAKTEKQIANFRSSWIFMIVIDTDTLK